MTSQRSKSTPGTTDPDTPVDYSIYLHIDGISGAMPWRIDDYGDAGALSGTDVREIAERAGLEASLIKELSRRLGYCLDSDTTANLVEVHRATASARGRKLLDDLKRRAERMQTQFSKIADGMGKLEPRFASEDVSNPQLAEAKQLAADLGPGIRRLEQLLSGMEDRPDVAFDMSPLDKRKVVDRRRLDVIMQCCATWEASGRTLAYNTAPQGASGQLAGPLPDFIQSVVVKLTDPAQELHGGTLRNDLDYCRSRPQQETWEDLDSEDIGLSRSK
ncbi:hypothetical protein SAMN05444413_1231 [Roseivivax marinus]|uniref:hypothetical protein n=1 Tax=Roseivivax marinus TaxID=1379903 RepID=UPI0008BCD4B7|nr:hypothetical protein [Roseivivax marinus]SEL92731.1 hypothetical protein SAMN05444413_1231 [Roseivivax marinus]